VTGAELAKKKWLTACQRRKLAAGQAKTGRNENERRKTWRGEKKAKRSENGEAAGMAAIGEMWRRRKENENG
jgi:hypothetical protein